MENKIELAKKILAKLNSTDYEHERAVCEKMLTHFMLINNITDEMLISEHKSEYRFYVRKSNLKLFIHVVCEVIQKSEFNYHRPDRSNEYFIFMTKKQFLEASYLFVFYEKEYEKQLKDLQKNFMTSFIIAHKIGLVDDDDDDDSNENGYDAETIESIVNLTKNHVKVVKPLKLIE